MLPVIVGLGEVLWDVFPDRQRPGGAPANVAYHAQALGNRGVVASRVGTDARGAALRQHLAEHGIDTAGLQEDGARPTGTVDVTIDDGEPSYTIAPDVAWDRLAWTDTWNRLAQEANAVCFSTLAQRASTSRATIHRFLDAVPAATVRILDVNLRPPHDDEAVVRASLARADVVKCNDDEWTRLKAISGTSDVASWLLDEKGVRLVCRTLGARGSELFRPGEHQRQTPPAVDTSDGDAVGVGDAFLATLTHHLLRDAPLERMLAAANTYAAYVATQRGGMPPVPANVRDAVA